MTTRSIVTSQPVLACGVCGRRLLRGEQPEVFLAGAERRTVCELCSPRAAHEGWLRESEVKDSLSLRPARRRRGVSLLDRLRALREPTMPPGRGPRPSREALHESDLSDEALEGLVHEQAVLREQAAPSERTAVQAPADLRESAEPYAYAPPVAGGSDLERALETFNAGEHPRRIAGVARSLGAPSVTVRSAGSGSAVSIVVAWELCWYRYQVDLDDDAGDASMLEKGTELDQLPPEDKVANAAADERGELALA